MFRRIYEENRWLDPESVSGMGSNLTQTAVLRDTLPHLFDELGVQTLVDAPCGDFHWMSAADLGDLDYWGLDILPEIIEKNSRGFGSERRRFAVLDLVASPVPVGADLFMCRDLLVHLSLDAGLRVLRNIARGDPKWVLLTTFTRRVENVDILPGEWRPLNLTLPPFDLPDPYRVIAEGCTEFDGRYPDKSLGLWTGTALRDALSRSGATTSIGTRYRQRRLQTPLRS